MSTERTSAKLIIQVAGTVIAAAILYFCRSLLPPIGKWFLGVGVVVWSFVIGGHSIPGWLLLVFIVCLLAVAWRVIRRFRRGQPKPHEPSKYDYTKDTVLGLTWRWHYGQQGIYDVVPFCLRCDMEVHPTLDYIDSLRTRTGYHCDNNACKNSVSVEGGHEYIEDQVTRQIQRKLRTGEWKQAISKSND